jgi:FMN-binding domain.
MSLKLYGTEQKKNPWEIDAISGSTITSNAVGRMFNQSGQKLHPLIAGHLSLLQSAKSLKRDSHGQPN